MLVTKEWPNMRQLYLGIKALIRDVNLIGNKGVKYLVMDSWPELIKLSLCLFFINQLAMISVQREPSPLTKDTGRNLYNYGWDQINLAVKASKH